MSVVSRAQMKPSPFVASCARKQQLAQRRKVFANEGYSVEDLKANVPVTAWVNPYINRLVKRMTFDFFCSKMVLRKRKRL